MSDNLIDIKVIAKALWKRKFFMLSIIFLFSISTLVYALSLPNIYTSSSLLAPSQQNKPGLGDLRRYNALAGLTGVNLPQDYSNKTAEAIAKIQSYSFFSEVFLPGIDKKDLVDVDKWDKNKNIIIYKKNNKDYSSQKAYKIYKKILSISEDEITGFITIKITHKSPYIARDWLAKIIYEINLISKLQEKDEAVKSIKFLEARIGDTQYTEIKNVLSELLQNETQSLMLTEANDAFVFKTIDSPYAPENKSAPSRALICILGFIFGSIVSTFMVLYLERSSIEIKND